jgi:hypothetical protein
MGGCSSDAFHKEGRWQEILTAIKPSDFVLIQFGHYDPGLLDARGKFRGSLKSIGDEAETVTHPEAGWRISAFIGGICAHSPARSGKTRRMSSSARPFPT